MPEKCCILREILNQENECILIHIFATLTYAISWLVGISACVGSNEVAFSVEACLSPCDVPRRILKSPCCTEGN